MAFKFGADQSKSEILAAIRKAREARYREQDGYRKIIDAVKRNPATEADLEKFRAIGLMGIMQKMKHERWPARQRDWKEAHQLSHKEIPEQKRINKIADSEIRGALMIYSEIAAHTQRLKSEATYCSLFGCWHVEIARAYAFWAEVAMKFMMHQARSKEPLDFGGMFAITPDDLAVE